MVGEGTVTLGVRRKEVVCHCGCVISALSGTLTFPDGEVVQISGRPSRLDYTVNHQVTGPTTKSVEDTSTNNPSSVALWQAAAISASDDMVQVPTGTCSLCGYLCDAAVLPATPLITETKLAVLTHSVVSG